MIVRWTDVNNFHQCLVIFALPFAGEAKNLLDIQFYTIFWVEIIKFDNIQRFLGRTVFQETFELLFGYFITSKNC